MDVTLDKVTIEIEANADKASKGIERFSETLASLRKSTTNTSSNLSKLSISIKDLSKNANAMNALRKSNEQFFKSVQKGAGKTISKIKQIGLSLLGTRTIFTATRKAVSEYMAMDAELTKQVTNNWRALGAQLAPAIEFVNYLFHQFVRVVYSVILALTGIDLIARANAKAMATWGKAAKDTLGNLQKFDDLNVVEFPKGTGDDNQLIDLTTIDLTPIQKIIDWVKKLRDEIQKALDTGKWFEVGKVFAEGLNEAMYSIDVKGIEEKLKDVARKFGQFLTGVFVTFDAKTFGTKLTEALAFIPDVLAEFYKDIPWKVIGAQLNNALSTFEPSVIINAIGDAITNLVGGLNDAFLQLDPSLLGQKITEVVVSVFDNFTKLLDRIDWKALGKKIRETILSIDWKEIWDSVVGFFEEAFKDITDFFSKLTGIDSDVIKDIASAFVTIGLAFATYKIAVLVGDFAGSILAIAASPIGIVLTAIAGIVTVINDIVNILKDPKASENWEKLIKDIIIFTGLIAGLVAAYLIINKLKDGTGGLAKSASALGKGKGLDFSKMFGDLGKAAMILAILGGIALVLKEVSELIKTFSESGKSVGDIGLLMAEVFGAIAVSFVALAAATKLLNAENLLSLIAIFAGITVTLLALNEVLKTITNSTKSAGEIVGIFAGVMVTIIALVAALTIAAIALSSNPLALLGILAVTASIVAIMLVLKETLPTILDAVGKFIQDIGPTLIRVLDSIFYGISLIIHEIGIALPPIINSVGKLFDKIFNGISNVVGKVGDVIVRVLDAIGRLVDNVFTSIIKFIEKLGPAVNNLVDNIIVATTKLINFMVSGVEFMINGIIDAINGLSSGLRKIGNKLFELIGVDVKFDPISRVYLNRFYPKLETGTNKVPYEGLYHLHPDEAVVPKKYNPALGGGSNEDTNRRLDTLIDLLNNMETTHVVNVGNETLYKRQERFIRRQNDIYGTDVGM